MNLERPSVAAASSHLSPVLAPDRIVALDVLRGIALLGVVIANVWLWFSGLAFRFPGYRQELQRFSLDSAVFIAIGVLVSGKAMSTFSFLFGHGFAIQMLRAEARGRSVAAVYARRLTVLLLIGVAHMLLLWYGDILTVYAALGFVLLLFRHRADRTLLVWAAIFLVGVPIAVSGVPWILQAAGVTLPHADLAAIARRNAATLAAFQGGSYSEIVQQNLHQAGKMYLGRKAPSLLFVVGLFLLGLYTGRHRVFERVQEYRRVFRRTAAWGIPIGLAGGIAMAVMRLTTDPNALTTRPGLIMLLTILSLVGMFPLAAGYVSAAALLVQSPAVSPYLSVFAPVGRMALTNYLSQTVVMLLIFYPYGGGLIGHTGPAVGLVIALAVFAAQAVASRIWLTYFEFGPMEWLWRSLTYGARQPMRSTRQDRPRLSAPRV